MKFTFGIITSNENQTHEYNGKNYMFEIIESIKMNNIPSDCYEIIVVGGNNIYKDFNNVKYIEFDDITKPGWITKKKNIITENAKYGNIVYSHDYIKYDKDWYNGFLKFGNDWDICMCVHQAIEGHRFRDWCTWDDPDINFPGGGYPSTTKNPGHRLMLPPYEYNKPEYMAISGFWWVAKKVLMLKEPLDEKLVWGDGEDIEWSFQVREKYNYKMNVHSIVNMLKSKKVSAEHLEKDDNEPNNLWIKKHQKRLL